MKKTEAEQNLLRDLRRHTGVSVSWSAMIRHGDKEAECRILDVCQTGVGIRLGYELEHGKGVELYIPNIGVLAGRVMWSKAGRAGILLDSSPDAMRATLYSRAQLDENLRTLLPSEG